MKALQKAYGKYVACYDTLRFQGKIWNSGFTREPTKQSCDLKAKQKKHPLFGLEFGGSCRSFENVGIFAGIPKKPASQCGIMGKAFRMRVYLISGDGGSLLEETAQTTNKSNVIISERDDDEQQENTGNLSIVEDDSEDSSSSSSKELSGTEILERTAHAKGYGHYGAHRRRRTSWSSAKKAVTSCPSGYKLGGDVPGTGRIGKHGGEEHVANCDACKKLCDSISSCKGYECSPSEKKCNLNTKVVTDTRMKYQDYFTCNKVAGSSTSSSSTKSSSSGGGSSSTSDVCSDIGWKLYNGNAVCNPRLQYGVKQTNSNKVCLEACKAQFVTCGAIKFNKGGTCWFCKNGVFSGAPPDAQFTTAKGGRVCQPDLGGGTFKIEKRITEVTMSKKNGATTWNLAKIGISSWNNDLPTSDELKNAIIQNNAVINSKLLANSWAPVFASLDRRLTTQNRDWISIGPKGWPPGASHCDNPQIGYYPKWSEAYGPTGAPVRRIGMPWISSDAPGPRKPQCESGGKPATCMNLCSKPPARMSQDQWEIKEGVECSSPITAFSLTMDMPVLPLVSKDKYQYDLTLVKKEADAAEIIAKRGGIFI